MAFFYYNDTDGKFIIATNLVSVSELSGMSYHKLYNLFNGYTGPVVCHGKDFVCGRTEIVKGKQRITEVKKEEVKKEERKEKTNVPDQRQRTVSPDFDEFFKEVKNEPGD